MTQTNNINTYESIAADKFAKLIADIKRGADISERALTEACKAAAKDAMYSKSADRANMLWEAVSGITEYAKACKRSLHDFTGGWYKDSFGTFRDSERAILQYDTKGKVWTVQASPAELAEAIAKYNDKPAATVQAPADYKSYKQFKFDTPQGGGLELAIIRKQLEAWAAKPDKWNNADADFVGRFLVEAMPLAGLEVPINVANRVKPSK